jgi:hypothetical protein
VNNCGDCKANDMFQITNLKARYFRLCDSKKFEELNKVLDENAVVDLTGAISRDEFESFDPKIRRLFSLGDGLKLDGLGNISRFYSFALGDMLTVHFGHTPEIKLTSASTARGSWVLEDVAFDRLPPHRKVRRGFGMYLDQYEKKDEWKIVESFVSLVVNEHYSG